MKNILNNKLYLYLTEFFSGVAVMAVELAASRLMAPYFSSSQIVYTIIIGTVMIAMALGNIYGGRTADKKPDPAIMYRRVLIAAVWIAAIPFAGRYIILAVSGLLILSVNSAFLVISAFVSCMLIFVFPLFLLGTVTPSLVRYIVQSTEESGKIVGRLGAANTIGSILGTFLPTFVTIPAVGTSATFILFSSILLVLSLLYFISMKRVRGGTVIAVVLFLSFSILGFKASFAFWEKDKLYEGESIYNYLQVKEESDRVILSTNVLFGVQSVKMKTDGLTGMYYDYALAGAAMAKAGKTAPPDILILGNGTGTFATQCMKYFDGCRLDAVEIDGKITGLAEEYFDMPKSVNVVEYDGRAFLGGCDGQYDLILVDAYQDITIPFQMSTTEFFTLVKEHLREDGIMVVNMNMHSDGDGAINQYLSDTIAEVFPFVCTADVAGNVNRELFASSKADCRELLKTGMENGAFPQDFLEQMEEVQGALVPYSLSPDRYILTDDKAPVEVLGMKMIDGIIREEVEYYRGIYEKDGLKGVIELLL